MNVTVEDNSNHTQAVANWHRLFSDERFRELSLRAHRDQEFIREHCRLGFEDFVQNSVDYALLLLYSDAAARQKLAIIGAPFTPCHWGALAVLMHLFRDHNFDLTAKRQVYWLTTERHERALFSRLRMHQKFRRVVEAVELIPSAEHYDGRCERTTLIMLRGVHELAAIPHDASVVISDPRGELVFRKGEADALVRNLRSITTLASLIIPSRSMTYLMSPDAVCWPWSEAALAKMQIAPRYKNDDDALPWKWEAGAELAGKTERRVIAVTGLKQVEDLLVELKAFSYSLFSKPKSFFDTRLMIEFQRIVGTFRQLAIPFDEHERSDDERRLNARLERLEADVDRATREIGEEIRIGLMFFSDLIRKMQETEGKWNGLRRCIDDCIAAKRAFALAFSQRDPYSAEQTLAYANSYVRSKNLVMDMRIINDPDELPSFTGDVVLVGVPKLVQASRWRIPFRGRLTILAWQYDRNLASIAMRESNESSEAVRRRTWVRDFKTPLTAHVNLDADISVVEEINERSDSEELNAQIEAFDLSYRGEIARSEAIVTDAVRAKTEYHLTFEDGSTTTALAGEEHHVLISSYAGNVVKGKSTAKLGEGDLVILVNGASYGQLTKRLQLEADRASSLLSFNELWERWQMLCLEQDENATVRDRFIDRLTNEFGCKRGKGTILSWLRLQRMGPDKFEDIACVALAAGDFELARNAEQLWRGLEQRRTRHRLLGRWLMRALALSAGTDNRLRNKIVDENLGLTFGDLQTGISVRRLTLIQPPLESTTDD